MNHLFIAFAITLFSVTALYAQAQNRFGDTPRQPPVRIAESPRDDRAQLEGERQNLRQRLGDIEKQLLQPSAQDFTTFAQPPANTAGLIRLLPREKYDGVFTIRGGGAYYSFTRRDHAYGYDSDISLEQNHFSVGFAGADFGFITQLGDTPLDQVTLDTPGVRYLAAFETLLTEPEAREQQRRRYPGFEVDGFTYTSRLPANVNKTYALRSVNYGNSDVLVAFRVAREDEDGSRILAWRLLKKFPTPMLERATN